MISILVIAYNLSNSLSTVNEKRVNEKRQSLILAWDHTKGEEAAFGTLIKISMPSR